MCLLLPLPSPSPSFLLLPLPLLLSRERVMDDSEVNIINRSRVPEYKHEHYVTFLSTSSLQTTSTECALTSRWNTAFHKSLLLPFSKLPFSPSSKERDGNHGETVKWKGNRGAVRDCLSLTRTEHLNLNLVRSVRAPNRFRWNRSGSGRVRWSWRLLSLSRSRKG